MQIGKGSLVFKQDISMLWKYYGNKSHIIEMMEVAKKDQGKRE